MKISTKSLSIYKITFISYISLTTIIVLLMAVLIYTSAYPLLTEITDKALISETNYVNQSIEATVNKTLFSSELLSKNKDFIEMVKEFLAADTYNQFYIGQSIESYMTDYWTTDLAVASSYLILPGSKYSPQRGNFAYIEPYETMIQAEWFKSVSNLSAAMVMQFNIDETLDSTHNSIPRFITAITQIYDYNNDSLGYLVVNFSARHFETNFYNSSHIVKDAYIYTVDNQGRVVYTNTSIPIGDFFDYNAAISTKSAKCIQSVDYSIICSKTNKHGWKTIQIAPSAPLYRKINSVKYITVIMIILTLILGLLLSLILSKKTTVPIMRLADNMKAFMKSGKFKKLDNSYENEIGTIIGTYNNMIDHIEQLMEDEKQHMYMRKQAELKMLQAQINPHFLYNTLDSISWNAIRNNAPEISNLLKKLARLYQNSLYKGLDVHPLSREVEQIELYMTLQQECFNSEFIYDIDIEDELLELYIPRFILQPIIENSVMHGFGGSKSKAVITISAYTDDKLHITISDNGKGIDFEILNKLNSTGYTSERYGIANIKERISLICGKEYGIEFSVNEPSGTTVSYTLPICENSDFFERR